jgi:hypothetical protein
VALNPGLVGLGVLDAFAMRLPVITCDLPYHSPEIEYLEHENNGLVLATDTSPELFGAEVTSLLLDRHRLRRLTSGAIQSAQRFSVEAMAERFANGVEMALSAAPRAAQR